MRSHRTVLTALIIAALVPSALIAGTLFGRKEKTAGPAAAAGADLAVIDLRVHELRTAGAEPRLVIQALVENQRPISRTTPFEVIVRRKDAKQALGACEGEALPQGQVAVCELWLVNEGVKQGDVFEAYLNRQYGDLNKWDTDPSDDRRTYEVRTIAEGGQVLRVANFDLSPTTVPGAGDVNFRFQVEGAHLVWLLAENRPPRLLGGYPSDGLLQGRGKERIASSGPVTLVARNSFGSYVYQTVPVANMYQQADNVFSKVPPQEVDGRAVMRVLDPGVFDIDEDQVILENLRNYLSTKDWRVFDRPQQDNRPRGAGVLNPKARTKDNASGDDGNR